MHNRQMPTDTLLIMSALVQMYLLIGISHTHQQVAAVVDSVDLTWDLCTRLVIATVTFVTAR